MNDHERRIYNKHFIANAAPFFISAFLSSVNRLRISQRLITMKRSLVFSLSCFLLKAGNISVWAFLNSPSWIHQRTASLAVESPLLHNQRQLEVSSNSIFFSLSALRSTTTNSISSSSLDTQEAIEFTKQGRAFFQQHFSFPLDDWQCQAGGAILQGRHVIVCAPTGAGKTVVGEMALLWNQRGIYTTPLKALSNQKYLELRQVYPNRCGLSTGDVSLSTDADICVMTTEVYRNRVWRGEEEHPDSTQVVILDEFHYIGNPGRGGVWEECVISCPDTTQLICLSATLANAASLRAWMESVTSRETVLIETKERPVPLQYLFATQDGLYPLFRNAQAGPGARFGLLGYRGDGVSSANNGKDGDVASFQTSRGFGVPMPETSTAVEKLPKGLQVNPALEAAAQRRAQRVQRTLERQKAAWRVQTNQKRNNESKRNYNENDSKYSNGGNNRKSLSPREERREKERLLKQEMRRAVPSISALVQRLQQKDLLPAIFFLFSRNGCDQAATSLYQYFKGPRDRLLDVNFSDDENEDDVFGNNRRTFPTRSRSSKNKLKIQNVLQDKPGRNFRTKSDYLSESVLSDIFEAGIDDSIPYDRESPLSKKNWHYYATAGLLDQTQVEKVSMRLETFNTENPEIALDTQICEQFLFGIGSHHAGLLPAQKSLVERLFQDQLLPVVFATETLAAGINMPARTTVLLSMAKRTGTGGSIQLLETANVLQMAGRAGRRGMDDAGTCVLVATSFESHQQAATILTDPILPIQSQFSPSYTLAIQLIERGQGQLNVAEELIRKSFALWQRRELAEATAVNNSENADTSENNLEAQERFWNDMMQLLEERSFSSKAIAKILKLFNDKESLKKTSKSFQGLHQMLQLEETTLQYLQKECFDLKEVEEASRQSMLGDFLCETDADLQHQMEAQHERIQQVLSQLQEHPFTMVTSIVNNALLESTPSARRLQNSLQQATLSRDGSVLQADQLSDFAKSAVVAQRKSRKSQQKKLKMTDPSLPDWAVEEDLVPDAWDDVLSIIKTLVAYGCLVEDTEGKYRVTHGGQTVGRLSLDNSLWALVAMGGAWDVVGVSDKFNEFRKEMYEFEQDELYPESIMSDPSVAIISPQEFLSASDEAAKLRRLLLNLPSAELAGYISCLVSERSDRENSGMLDTFHRLSVQQQRVIESSLTVMERFMQVQKDYDVDTNTRQCAL
jgi:superfamily II RNA helicase